MGAVTAMKESPDTWSGLHDLAFVYVVFSKVTDKVLQGVEANEIINSLQEWVPALTREDAQTIFTGALKRYESIENWHPYFLQSLIDVKEMLSETNIVGVVGDLVSIAKSDNRILDNEKRLIGEVACILIGDVTDEALRGIY